MNTQDLNTALYEKMVAEQDTFREDIVMAMEELELSDAQAKALLESPSPLADVYRYFGKLETGYMDTVRDSIENRANDVCREKEKGSVLQKLKQEPPAHKSAVPKKREPER